MLFLPAAALCCLCSALVAMAAELSQDQLTLTRRVGETGSIGCTGFDNCATNYAYWYQKVLCAVGGSDDSKHLIFGPGTKLLVSDEQVVKPVVSVYPAASRVHLEGRSSLLCLASGMFPPLVRFSWKRQKKNGGLEELPPAEGEQLELRESGRSASIRIVDRDPLHTYKYSCSVEHEGGRVEAQTQQEVSPPAHPGPTAAALHWFRERLLCLLYTLLIVKSLVCCCGLSLLMILRNKGASSGCTHAD